MFDAVYSTKYTWKHVVFRALQYLEGKATPIQAIFKPSQLKLGLGDVYLLRGAAALDALRMKRGTKVTPVDNWVTADSKRPLEAALADKTENHSMFDVTLAAGDAEKVVLGSQFECLQGAGVCVFLSSTGASCPVLGSAIINAVVQIAHVGNTFFTRIHHEDQAAGGVAILQSELPVRKLWLIYDVPAHAARLKRSYMRKPDAVQVLAAASRFLVQQPGDCVVFSNGCIHSVLTEFGNTEFGNSAEFGNTELVPRPFVCILLGCSFHAPDEGVVEAAKRTRFSRAINGRIKRITPRIRPYTKPELRKLRFQKLIAKRLAAQAKRK